MSDHCARKRELENWWKAEENSQAALDIQCLVLRAIYELWGCIGKNPAAAQRCREILAKPLEKFRTTLTSIRENPTHNMSPDATQTQWTGPRKQQFHDFVAMVRNKPEACAEALTNPSVVLGISRRRNTLGSCEGLPSLSV